MSKHRTDVVHASPIDQDWFQALMEFVSTLEANANLTLANSTTIQIVAATGSGQVALGMGGPWRYRSTTIQQAHPGGGSGTYDIYAVASANAFVAGTPETDNTDYTFGLAIVTGGGAAPTGTFNGHAIALTRKIGTLQWSGTAITGLFPSVGQVQPTFVGDVTARAGLSTQVLAGSSTGGAAGLLFGSAGDASLYRTGAAGLRTNSALVADSDLTARNGAATQVLIGSSTGGNAGVSLGSAADATLYRGGAGIVQTSGYFKGGAAGATSYMAEGSVWVGHGTAGTTSANGLIFGSGGLENLYRLANQILKTDSALEVAQTIKGSGSIIMNYGLATEVRLNAIGGTTPGLTFGATGAENLYRLSAGIIKTDNSLYSAGDVNAWHGGATVAVLGQVGPASEIGVKFGAERIWRDAVGRLRTDNNFWVDRDLRADTGGVGGVLSFGSAQDTWMWRLSAATLEVHDKVYAYGSVRAGYGTVTSYVEIGAIVAGAPGLTFGSAVDTNLYRPAVATLKTDVLFTALRLAGRAGGNLTTSAGAITVTGGFHKIVTNAGNADLTTINGTSDGAILVLRNSTGGLFNVTTAGNISLISSPAAFAVNATKCFIYNNVDSKWEQITA